MTNIVYWNIQQFGIKKIRDNSGAPATGAQVAAGAPVMTKAVAAAQRLNLIMSILREVNPDIIVIIEVGSGTTQGDLASNSGGQNGAWFLLNQLRGITVGPLIGQWRLVPPLRVAQPSTETVAVIYRAASANGTVRYFTGPNVWSGGATGLSVQPGAAPALAYPPRNQSMLVPPGTAARGIPAASLYRGSPAGTPAANLQSEALSAARINFTSINNARKRLRNSDQVAYGKTRQPYMVTFCETNAAGVVLRNLSLFAIHAPPQTSLARNYMNESLAFTAEIVDPPVANDNKILLGDFNLNALSIFGANTNEYASLVAYNYLPLINPVGMPAANEREAYQGYFTTHIQKTPGTVDDPITEVSRFLWSDVTTATISPYPAYRYLSLAHGTYPDTYSIDNVLVNPGVAVANNYAFTILNPITGTPFNLVGAPPNNAPIGAQALLPKFTALPLDPAGIAIPWPQSPAPAFTNNFATAMCLWNNYGRIRSTSDHLPLFMTI